MMVGSLIVRSMLQDGKVQQFEKVFMHEELALLALTKIGWRNNGKEILNDGYVLLYSGGDDLRALNEISLLIPTVQKQK